jgi:hypothetical protein
VVVLLFFPTPCFCSLVLCIGTVCAFIALIKVLLFQKKGD